MPSTGSRNPSFAIIRAVFFLLLGFLCLTNSQETSNEESIHTHESKNHRVAQSGILRFFGAKNSNEVLTWQEVKARIARAREMDLEFGGDIPSESDAGSDGEECGNSTATAGQNAIMDVDCRRNKQASEMLFPIEMKILIIDRFGEFSFHTQN